MKTYVLSKKATLFNFTSWRIIMRNKLFFTLAQVAIATGAFVPAQSKAVETIEHYGVYVAAKSGYIKLEPYKHSSDYVDFKHLNELPSVERADESLRLVVFQKSFDEENLTIKFRPIQTTVDIREINFNVKPLEKEGMYELTTEQTISTGVILQVQSGSWGTNMNVVVLGDTQKELEKYFSRKDLDDAYAVKLYLDDALQAYPENSTLKGLSDYWGTEAQKQKAAKTYGYVETQWEKYQGTKKINLRVRYLKSLIGEINGYLNDHGDGEKAEEAKERKLYAEKTLQELQEQL
ncbi:MAG: hypothetical protein L3J24_03590 [Xanthomonadales bacterium]|nr:hypothetical protein [Xanthomonadales bacterium]